MTLQQLRYIIAINRHRSFAKAAAELDVTQPTLSSLLVKLEDELGVRIFERNNRTVTPTAIGETIIRQAEKTVGEAERITEAVAEQKGDVAGLLAIGIGPTIAPYLMPWFIKKYSDAFPKVKLSVNEMKGESIVEALRLGRIDMGIAMSGHDYPWLNAIPLYTEPFHVYMAGDCRERKKVFNPSDLLHEKMWIMKESQCMRESAFIFCKARSIGRHIYEAGSIDTLIRIVDVNGGFTIIPEMHLQFLTESQRENVRPIGGEYVSKRSVSIYTRNDFIRRNLLRSVTDTLVSFIPGNMVSPELKAY